MISNYGKHCLCAIWTPSWNGVAIMWILGKCQICPDPDYSLFYHLRITQPSIFLVYCFKFAMYVYYGKSCLGSGSCLDLLCSWLVKITEEPGVSSTGKREEEGLFDWSGGEGEGPGEEELGDGREALHPPEWEPDAPTGTFYFALVWLCIWHIQICVLFDYLSSC